MIITLNNQELEVNEGKVLSDFVFDQVGEKQNGIAIAINGEVKPKSIWTEVQLKEHDDILLIKATQGG